MPTYAYEFNDPDAPTPPFVPPEREVGFDYRAAHTAESEYLFRYVGPEGSAINPEFTADQKQLSKTMIRYWTQFARAGDPNSPMGELTFWPEYRSGTDEYLSLEPPSPRVINDFAQDHNCSFWTSFLATGR